MFEKLRTIAGTAVMSPLRAMRREYLPILTVYFAYGLSGVTSIAETFWQKEETTLTAEQLISIRLWLVVPWTAKVLVGQCVDSIPLFGSGRRAYIVLGAGLSFVGALLFAGLASRLSWLTSLGSDYQIYLVSVIVSTFGFMIQDVAADTLTSEVVPRWESDSRGRRTPRSDADVQRDLTMLQALGRLVLGTAILLVSGAGGLLAAHVDYSTVFWAASSVPFLAVVGVSFVPRLADASPSKDRPRIDPRLVSAGVAFLLFSSAASTLDWQDIQEAVFLASFSLTFYMIWVISHKSTSGTSGAMFLTMLAFFLYRAAPPAGPGLQWWYIDELGFDASFFGVLAQTGALVSLTVLWFLSGAIARRPIRTILLLLVGLEFLVGIPELALYYKVHELVGLQARTVALFDTTIESPLVGVSVVPILGVIAYYAPLGSRGTWFAVTASLLNLALAAGYLLSNYLNRLFIVSRAVYSTDGHIITAADYSQLGNLLIARLAAFALLSGTALLLLPRRPEGAVAPPPH